MTTKWVTRSQCSQLDEASQSLGRHHVCKQALHERVRNRGIVLCSLAIPRARDLLVAPGNPWIRNHQVAYREPESRAPCRCHCLERMRETRDRLTGCQWCVQVRVCVCVCAMKLAMAFIWLSSGFA